MARPLKLGLDYFPLDVMFDDSIELFEAECGLEGLAILIKLWQKIYSHGYYTDWNNDTVLLFSKKINSTKEIVNSVINTCLRRSIFNKSLYEKYNILTSSGIQKRYVIACTSTKRKNITMDERFLLINDKNKTFTIELIPFTPEETRVNPGESTQTESKQRVNRDREETEKNIILEIENFRQRYDKDLIILIERYLAILRTTRVSGKISDSIIKQVYEEMDKRPIIVVKYACKTVIDKPDLHSKKENYFYGIMRNTKADEAEKKLSFKPKNNLEGVKL